MSTRYRKIRKYHVAMTNCTLNGSQRVRSEQQVLTTITYQKTESAGPRRVERLKTNHRHYKTKSRRQG